MAPPAPAASATARASAEAHLEAAQAQRVVACAVPAVTNLPSARVHATKAVAQPPAVGVISNRGSFQRVPIGSSVLSGPQAGGAVTASTTHVLARGDPDVVTNAASSHVPAALAAMIAPLPAPTATPTSAPTAVHLLARKLKPKPVRESTPAATPAAALALDASEPPTKGSPPRSNQQPQPQKEREKAEAAALTLTLTLAS